MRTRHYSPLTEKAYVHWIRQFIFFHNKRHPAEMGPAEISAVCGLIADAVLIGLTIRGGLSSGMPLRLTTAEVEYGLLPASPFVVGALYAARRLFGSQPEPAQ